MDTNKTITVWKDGSWKVWNSYDAELATNDPDWLVNINLNTILTVLSLELHAKVE